MLKGKKENKNKFYVFTGKIGKTEIFIDVRQEKYCFSKHY